MTKPEAIDAFKKACLLEENIQIRKDSVQNQFQRDTWQILDYVNDRQLQIFSYGTEAFLVIMKKGEKGMENIPISIEEYEELKTFYWGDTVFDEEKFNETMKKIAERYK